MDLIDEVIGYAKANAEAATSPDDRQTWEAHKRNCERVKAETIEPLQEAKRMAGLIADERSRENVALRAALRQIADMSDSEADEPFDDCIAIAERALAHEQKASK